MATRSIDLEGLTEEQVRALEEQAAAFRREQAHQNGQPPRITFHEKQGTVFGNLTRREIYADE